MINDENDFIKSVHGALKEITSRGVELVRMIGARATMAAAAAAILGPIAAKPVSSLVQEAANTSLGVISAGTHETLPAAPTSPSGSPRFKLVQPSGPSFS
jgi:hypothetical protein